MSIESQGHEIRLASRPHGEASAENFQLVKTDIPQLQTGEVLVRNSWMSVDPYMRARMNDVPSYLPPFQIDQPLEGSAIGEVIASESPEVEVGTQVSHFAGWRSHAVVGASDVIPIDTSLARPEDYLGALGTTGLTAYIALKETAPVEKGDVVFISAAAGAVGSVAGQLARHLGAKTVIGSAGGPVKRQRLIDDFGFDVALDYRAAPIGEQLAQAAPDGIDVYVDNVGGDHLEAALDAIRINGRIALVGAISSYNATGSVPGPRDFARAISKRLSLRGMLVLDHMHRFPQFVQEVAPLIADGTWKVTETVVEGLENAPEAFLGVLRGDNTGKMLVRI
ncbi:NADP-dependent oxidoreductase [Natronoglycomyces albus]|uniref:NADP-dependent oxidoreductase n=1 Tax=Natronoglycomyces albus TaxID=2811108 RepID=A0A895XIJ9_9ACTN|nr:NADP-dependent oxidoreductase [Natronoglycomyces albus]QSB05164.1 NADP-dependent oxidoreductase [Natronoglycomyces albus]